jgi:hypothetical protein
MSWRFMAILLACLVVAGCADSGSSADNNKNDNRFGGFYGGLNGGGGTIH